MGHDGAWGAIASASEERDSSRASIRSRNTSLLSPRARGAAKRGSPRRFPVVRRGARLGGPTRRARLHLKRSLVAQTGLGNCTRRRRPSARDSTSAVGNAILYRSPSGVLAQPQLFFVAIYSFDGSAIAAAKCWYCSQFVPQIPAIACNCSLAAFTSPLIT